MRFATDNESIGAVICKRADQLQASCVVMAKHNKGAIKVRQPRSRRHAVVPCLSMCVAARAAVSMCL